MRTDLGCPAAFSIALQIVHHVGRLLGTGGEGAVSEPTDDGVDGLAEFPTIQFGGLPTPLLVVVDYLIERIKQVAAKARRKACQSGC